MRDPVLFGSEGHSFERAALRSGWQPMPGIHHLRASGFSRRKAACCRTMHSAIWSSSYIRPKSTMIHDLELCTSICHWLCVYCGCELAMMIEVNVQYHLGETCMSLLRDAKCAALSCEVSSQSCQNASNVIENHHFVLPTW
jgi:hypothetical protein